MFVSPENMMITFLVCHMIGVSSACTNPVLYGFLNENFLKVGIYSGVALTIQMVWEFCIIQLF